MKKIDTSNRTQEIEIMDDFDLEGAELKEALDKIAKINQFLGGNKLTLQGLTILLKNADKAAEIVIVDIGCGNGDMLRYIAEFGIQNQYNFKLIGVDANAFTINYALELSKEYSNISYKCMDIFDKAFEDIKYDIILATLTLHHFENQKIISLLKVFYKNSRFGIVINDLHRNIIAYRLFQLVCFVFSLNTMSKNDGLTSILRGFKKQELQEFCKRLNFKKYSIQWKWAFRHQWIIWKS